MKKEYSRWGYWAGYLLSSINSCLFLSSNLTKQPHRADVLHAQHSVACVHATLCCCARRSALASIGFPQCTSCFASQPKLPISRAGRRPKTSTVARAHLWCCSCVSRPSAGSRSIPTANNTIFCWFLSIVCLLSCDCYYRMAFFLRSVMLPSVSCTT